MTTSEGSAARAPSGAVATADELLDRPWSLGSQVALRQEPFGALLYDYRSRRLSFLKHPLLVAAVEHLATSPTARAACLAAGADDDQVAVLARSLATLARTGMIEEPAMTGRGTR